MSEGTKMEETCIDRGLRKMLGREHNFEKAVEDTKQKIKETEEEAISFI